MPELDPRLLWLAFCCTPIVVTLAAIYLISDAKKPRGPGTQ